MHPSLFFLLSLVGAAVASHEICFFRDYSVIPGPKVRDAKGILLEEGRGFGAFDSMYTFEDGKGNTVHVSPGKGWSASFRGVDWGGFSFEKTYTFGSGYMIQYGCYDTTHTQYCYYNEAMYLRYLERFGIKPV